MSSYVSDLVSGNIRKGFEVLLTECLKVIPEDNVLVIYDEAFLRFLSPLVELAIGAKLRFTLIFFPKTYQRAVLAWAGGDEHQIDLPHGIVSACGEASVILNCLDGDLETSSLRGAILNRLRPKECRFAHIPGMSDEILSILTTTPIQEVLDSAQTVAWALGEAHSGRLTTFDSVGNECHLNFDLDGWDNEPMMSPGVIFSGSWGNSPPGEVFCCPDPERIDGTVCINGSIPGQVLAAADATTLQFESGHITDWWPKTTCVAHFLNEQKLAAIERHDPNWRTFAELGIGLNPAVKTLTGNPLLDEKALGTIHVAIGDNRTFGHTVKSFIHADMVILEPTLELDERKVMNRGTLLIEDLKQIRLLTKLNSLPLSPEINLNFRDAKLEFRNGVLSRKLVSAGRIGYVPILELSEDGWLKDFVRDVGEGTVSYAHLQDFRSKTCMDESRLQYALGVLHHYRILTLENSGEDNGRTANKGGPRRSVVRQYRAGS